MATLTPVTGAAPINASNDTYASFLTDSNDTLVISLADVDADLGTMTSLNWQIEYSMSSAPNDDTYDLSVRIVNGATILAAADAGGTFASVANAITSATDITTAVTAFAYVNAGNKALWDGATIELQQTYSKSKGSDGTNIQIDFAEFTGTYEAGVALVSRVTLIT